MLRIDKIMEKKFKLIFSLSTWRNINSKSFCWLGAIKKTMALNQVDKVGIGLWSKWQPKWYDYDLQIDH